MNKTLLFTVIFFALWCKAHAGFEFNHRLEEAYQNILTLHFNNATRLLKMEKTENPGNHLTLLYENYIDFLIAFISEEQSSFEQLKRNTGLRIEQISEDEQKSPFSLYALAELDIQLALVKVKFEEHIGAAAEIRKAFKLIDRNKKLYPSFVLNKKVSGFLHAVVGAVPARYNWIVSIAGMEGSVSEGLKELEDCYKSTGNSEFKCYQVETLFYLGTIYSVFATNTETVPMLETMKSTTESSPLISYVYSNIMMKRGQNEEAIWALDAGLSNTSTYPFTFLYYKRALCKLRKLDLAAADDIRQFITHYRGINNIKSAWQKLGWISLLEKDTLSYRQNMRSCLESGKALIDEDRDAQYEASSGEMVNLYLMRSRLLFDGGYYQRALSELAGKSISDFPRFRDQLEITYRLGRIQQMMKNTDKAIQNYETTIRNGSDSRWHFAANSSLMLGNIYEERKEYQKAMEYYKKCLEMKNDQYKNSIDQKAKASIDRIKAYLD